MRFFAELKRRNVLRVGAAYIVTAWLVVQVVETLFPVYGLSDPAIRLVVNVLAIGLVPVLVLAWVFEWTPEGLKRDADVTPSAPAAADSAKRLDRIILVVLALALGYFAFDKFVLDPARDVQMAESARQEGRSEAIIESYGDASIAVLAFADMSPNKDQEYLSDGIAEEVRNLLASVKNIRVTGRTSSFMYRNKEVPVTQIARELNVSHLLEGSVRKSGNRIRITAQLIEGRSDTHLWSRSWDRALDNVFAIQDEIAAEVVKHLEAQIAGPMPTSITTDPETYAYTLQARQLLERRTDHEQVYFLLEQALSRDPDYLPALEALITQDMLATFYGYISSDEGEQSWQRNSKNVLSLDPDNATVLSYGAYILYQDERAFEAAISQLMDLIAREPNNTELLKTSANLLRRTGYFEDAVRLGKHCIELDPLKHSCVLELKEAYMWSGNIPMAREYTDRLKARWNQPFLVHDLLLLLWEGKPAEAKVLLVGKARPSAVTEAWLALVEHKLGNVEVAEKRLLTLIDEIEQSEMAKMASVLAGVYAMIERPDDAFAWLEIYLRADPASAYDTAFEPFLKNLHSDPRFGAYLEGLGLGSERRSAFQFDLPLPD